MLKSELCYFSLSGVAQLGPCIPLSCVSFCCREGGSCRPWRERSSCNLTSSCQILTVAKYKHFRVSDMVYTHVFGRQKASATSYSGPKQPTWPVGPWNTDWALRMQGYLGCAISQHSLIVFLLLKEAYAVEIAAVLLARLFLLTVLRELCWLCWQVHESQWVLYSLWAFRGPCQPRVGDKVWPKVQQCHMTVTERKGWHPSKILMMIFFFQGLAMKK